MSTAKTKVNAEDLAGVDLSKVMTMVLKDAYQKTLKRVPDVSTPEHIAKAVADLSAHFVKVSNGGEIMACDLCGGGSPAALFPNFCPFCGDSDEDSKVAPELANAVAAVPPAGTVKKLERRVKQQVAPPPAMPSTPVSSPVEQKKTALAKVTTSTVVVSVGDLDNSIKRINKSRGEGAAALWAISLELRTIYEHHLWKLRNDSDGKPMYKSFDAFIKAEIDLHSRTVWRMIELTKEFTEGDAAKYGVTILKGLLAAPKEDRAEILEKVDAGVVKGKRGVEREVQKIRASGKVPSKTGKKTSKATAAAAKSSAAKAAEKKKFVTVAIPAGRKTVKLYVRHSGKGPDPMKKAKKVVDRPYGKLECANGVTMHFALIENNYGELEIAVEGRRDE